MIRLTDQQLATITQAASELKADDIRKFMLSIAARIQVHVDRIDVILNPINLPRWFGRMDRDAPDPKALADLRDRYDTDQLSTLTTRA